MLGRNLFYYKGTRFAIFWFVKQIDKAKQNSKINIFLISGFEMAKKHKPKMGARCYRGYSPEKLRDALDNNLHTESSGRPSALSAEEEWSIDVVMVASTEYGCSMAQTDLPMVVKSYLDAKGI